jgi:hypothetical protein
VLSLLKQLSKLAIGNQGVTAVNTQAYQSPSAGTVDEGILNAMRVIFRSPVLLL